MGARPLGLPLAAKFTVLDDLRWVRRPNVGPQPTLQAGGWSN